MEAIKDIFNLISDSALFGAFVNTAAVIVGALLGLLLKRGIPDKIGDTVMKGLSLCVLMIGVQGIMKGSNTLITILSVVLGGLLGELCHIDDGIRHLGEFAEKNMKNKDGTTSVAEGFVTASLLFVVGAMAVVGSLQSGLTHDHSTVYAKSMLDFVSAVIFSSSLGIGVLLSSVAVLVYQGSITLLAGLLAPILNEATIAEMTAAGSVLIIALSLNMLGVCKIKVASYLPAIFLPILFCMFF